MSDSGEPKTSVQETKLAEQESKSEQGEMTKKRMLEAEEDEDSKSESSRLENPKKVSKQTSRKLETDYEPAVLPSGCPICRRPLLDPVVTNCYHYFCKNCALKRHRESNKCFLCNEPTLGVFNTAVEVKQRIAETRKKARDMMKEVLSMVEKASAMVDDAKVISEKAAKMVEEVETMMEKVADMAMNAGETATKAAKMVEEVETMVEKVADMAMNAGETATKAAKMVKEADIMMETAKAKMFKASALGKTVMWNV